MIKKKIIILSIIAIIILIAIYFVQNKQNSEEVIILENKQSSEEVVVLEDKQENISGIYSDEEYGFYFLYPQEWYIKKNSPQIVQFYNYLKPNNEILSKEIINKIEVVIVDDFNYEETSDYPETSKFVEDVIIVGQNSKKVETELVGGEKIKSYYIPIPLNNNYIILSIYGDYNNFHVLDEVVESLKWIN